MPFRLIVGRPNSGRTGVLYDVVRRSLADGRAPVVVLPSRPDAQVVAREFAEHGPKLGAKVAVLDEYIDELWTSHGDGRAIVGNSERSVLLTHAARTAELEELERSAAGDGLARLLAPLAANGVDRVRDVSARGGTASEIARILLGYREMLALSGLVERADAVRCLESFGQGDWAPEVLIGNRFSDLTQLQERFMLNASRHGEVWLALPWQEGLPATRALDGLVGRLAEAGAEIEALSSGAYTSSEELRYLEEHLFSRPDDVLLTPRRGHVRLSEAYGEEAEAQRIAAEVQAALAEGTSPDQIAVVFGRVADHAGALRLAFEEAGIKASFDVLRPLHDIGWGRALAHLMSFASTGHRSDLTGYIRSPYSGVSQSAGEGLEARWVRGRVEREDRLIAMLRAECPSAADTVSQAKSLLRDSKDVELRHTVQKWKNLADQLLSNAYGAAAVVLDDQGVVDASGHRTVIGLVGRLASVPGLRLSAPELADTLLRAEVPIAGPMGPDMVRVMSAVRARSQRYKVVIFGGLSAGDFPRAATEGPLNTTHAQDALMERGIDSEQGDEQDRARLTFYLVASRATERLVLSRQVAASDGSELRPSWLLEEVLDLYRDPASEVIDEGLLPPRSVLRFDQLGADVNAPSSSRREMRDAATRGSGTGQEAARLALARRRAATRTPGLADEGTLSELGERRVFSATEIEAYLRCPYAWFHDRVVRAEALEPGGEALERGRLCHEALRRIYEAVPDALGAQRVTADNLRGALEIARTVLDEVFAADGEASEVMRLATRAAVRRKVTGFLRADASFLPGFEPLALELSFDPEPGVFDGFELRGRIDRIDRGPEGELVIVDYKTGSVGSSYARAKFEQRGLLQLALYARVAERALGGTVAAGLYRGVSGQNVRGKQNRGFYAATLSGWRGLVGTDAATPDEIAELVGDAEARAAEATDRIRSGEIPAEPRDERSCLTCQHSVFCPRGVS